MRFSLEAFNSEIKLWKRMDVGKAIGINKSCNRYTLREDFMLQWQLSIVAELNNKKKKKNGNTGTFRNKTIYVFLA